MGVLYTIYTDGTTSASFGRCGGIFGRVPIALPRAARLLTFVVRNVVQIYYVCCAVWSVVHDESTVRFTHKCCTMQSVNMHCFAEQLA